MNSPTIKLGDISYVTKLAGFEHTKYIQHNATHQKNDVPLVIGKNVKGGKVIYEFDWYIPNSISDALPRSVLNKRCLVIPYVGSKLGELAIFRNDFKCHLGSNVAKVELLNDILDLDYLYYYLTSSYGQLQLFKGMQGSAQPNITMGSIRDTVVVVHEKYTQKRIAKVLSDLDAKIELNNKVNGDLESMAKLIYDYWFVQFDFPNAKGKPYKTSGGKMVWSDELNRDIPHGWEVRELEECIERIIDHRGKTPSKLGSDWTTDENGIIALSAKIVKGGKLINLEEANRVDNILYNKWMPIKLKNGDILMTSEAPAGEFYFIHGKTDYCLSQRLFAIRANQETIIPSYLYFELSKGHGYSQIMGSLSGSTVFGIRQDVLRTIRVLIPNYDLQKKFDQIILPQLRQIKELEQQNQKLSELRDWLLPMLMNGQVQIKEAGIIKVVKHPVKEVSFKPANPYFYQTQVVAAIVNVSKQHKISHGEMTLAKYSYLLDKVYKVPTLFKYDRWHLGPWSKEMKALVNNKKFFKIQDKEVTVVPQKKEYNFQFQKQVEDAITELVSIFNQYKGKERSYQTELLATVCKVVEDIQSTDLKAVRESMVKWPIDLKGEKFKNKAEKFGEEETKECLQLIIKKEWQKLLLSSK
ncbi:MAG TPA: restriction endonuclease subunit S [Cyclobacteriaceae bacterium]|jgi:type I restriction enzyme S subunit|nr:restriction endonuclease subunit S [Cyclobacteriaceae bacterium]